MNIAKIFRNGYRINFSKIRCIQSEVKQTSSNESEIENLQKQDLKATANVSGITVVSLENYSPITHVSVLVKAGSRYEGDNNLGIVHCLRNCTSLSSKSKTSFFLTRNIELQGGKLSAHSTREHMVYSLKCIRDNIDPGLECLSEIACNQAFKPWELEESTPRMNIDLAVFEKNPEAVLMEALHKAAFRGGLANSLYSLPFMVGKYSPDMLLEYVFNHFTPERTVVVGLGINHDHLENAVTKLFSLKSRGNAKTGESKFGGGEVRVEADIPFTRAAIVAEGASLSNTKEMLSLGVLQHVLGTGSPVTHSTAMHTKLGSAAAKATDQPFTVSALNVNYSDNGLFGVYIAGHPNHMRGIVKSVVSQMRDITKKLSDEDVKNAKHAFKTRLFLERESSSDQIEKMAVETAAFGHPLSVEDLEKTIDSLTVSDISAVANKVMKTKPAMAAVGQLHSTPYVDELI